MQEKKFLVALVSIYLHTFNNNILWKYRFKLERARYNFYSKH